MNAVLAVDAGVGPVRAFASGYMHAGDAGVTPNLFGVHKEDGSAAISRIFGLAAVGPTRSCPLSAHALVLDMRDDPKLAADTRLAAATRAMVECGLNESTNARRAS